MWVELVGSRDFSLPREKKNVGFDFSVISFDLISFG